MDHVVEEGDAGLGVTGAGAVEVDGYMDIGFAGGAVDCGGTGR